MNMQEVAQQLTGLERDGRLNPQSVVDSARDPASPMHDFFEWNDTEAANQHRLGQARQLIRRVKIEVVVRDVPMNVVRYVRDPDSPTDYRTIVAVRTEEDTARRVLLDEMSRVVKAAKRARAVAAILGTGTDIEEILNIANLVVTRIQPDINGEPAGAA